ncbi:MAG: hypothetical protein WBM50_13655 [Acidimicrobiales bacterium]
MAFEVLFYDDATPYDITCDVYSINIRRGRTLELENIGPGTCVLQVRNHTRNFDPYFLETLGFLLQGSGDFLLQTSGDKLIARTSSNSTGDYGPIEVGRKIRVSDDGVVVFTGIVEDYDYGWTQPGEGLVTITCADALTTLAASDLSEHTTTRQLPGPRIASILSRPEVDFPTGAANRDLDDGLTWLEPAEVQDDTNALRYCQTVALSDLYRLFADRTDKIVGRSRETTRAQTASVDFGNNAIDIDGVDVRFGSEQLHFKVSVSRVGGTPRIATNQTAIDANPRQGARQRNIVGLLSEHDAYSEAFSEGLVARFSSPFAVVSGLELVLNGMSVSDRADVAALDINDIVTLDWTPTCSGGSVSQTLIVEGCTYETSIADQRVRKRLHLSAIDTNRYWTLEDPELGFIDVPDIVLAY